MKRYFWLALSALLITVTPLISCKSSEEAKEDAVSYTASGPYTYTSNTATLEYEVTETNWPADCATVKIWVGMKDQQSNTSPTENTMKLHEMDWTRDSGTAGDIVGLWKTTTEAASLEWAFNQDGSFNLTAQNLNCSSSSSQSTIPSVLQNTSWVRSCITNSKEAADERVGWSYDSGSTATSEHFLYATADGTCTTPKSKNLITATVNFGGDPTNQVQSIDLSLGVFTRTVLTTDEVAEYNSTNRCGFNDWVQNVPKDITQTSCGASGIYYGLVKVDKSVSPNLLYDSIGSNDPNDRGTLRDWGYLKQ